MTSYNHAMLEKNFHLNQRVPMETILSPCLKSVCHILLTNSLLEII